MTAASARRADPGVEGDASDRASQVLESEIDYLARRAREERELAVQASNSSAAMAHMYLAAAYANRIVEQTVAPSDFEDLLRQLDSTV